MREGNVLVLLYGYVSDNPGSSEWRVSLSYIDLVVDLARIGIDLIGLGRYGTASAGLPSVAMHAISHIVKAASCKSCSRQQRERALLVKGSLEIRSGPKAIRGPVKQSWPTTGS
jgi:hypothetical protein